MSLMKCTAAGDSMVIRRLPEDYPGLVEMAAFIRQGDVRFVNMETTIHNYETYGAAQSGGTRGLCYDKRMYEAIIPYWEAEDGKLTKLTLMPIELNFDKGRSMGGWPRPKYDSGILERLAQMSEPYGTRIEIRDGLGYVEV